MSEALKHSPVIEEDNADFFNERSPKGKSVLSWWKVAVQTLFGLLSLSMLLASFRISKCGDQQCAMQLSAYSPALNHISFEKHYFDGFYDKSPFKGHPDPELDDEWNRLIRSGYVSISEDAMTEKLHKNKTYVTLPSDQDGGYLGNLEVYHQLHCLNLIRQYTYEEYYRDLERLPMEFTDSDGVLRQHVGTFTPYPKFAGCQLTVVTKDHCIDYLRQLIMCTGDVGIHTYFWMKGRDLPFPDFRVERKCRAWSSIEAFAIQAHGNITLPKKPQGVFEHEHP
ncbi:hypothetical protein VTL71DRAFT_6677 [Oculimacula yallundae]|uniref:Tat pathway signal sequence n=1 Tax=Oculimacula yallundae TaxID=86028 RepID=A0ABR4BXM1_9HELO